MHGPTCPNFWLPLGTQCEGTHCKRAPHKAHTSLCNVDNMFINFHGILNIKYNNFHFPLQKSFLLYSLECPVLYVTRMTYHIIYVSLFLPHSLLQQVSLFRVKSGDAQEYNTHPCLQICLWTVGSYTSFISSPCSIVSRSRCCQGWN